MICPPGDQPSARPFRPDQNASRAQSEVVGIALLVGVFALLSLTVSVALIGGVNDQVSDEPLVDLNASVTASNLTLHHGGGDTLTDTEVTVVLRQDGAEQRFGLASFSEEKGVEPSRFSGGERWQRSHGLAAGPVQIFVVHGPSNAAVYAERLAVPPEDNASPTARFEYGPDAPGTGEKITFNASNATDPDGTIADYTWDFDDGNVTTTADPVINHTYATAGEYNVTLTVTDDDGATASRVASLTVNSPPTANFSADCATTDCTFDASNSTDDGTIANYTWDFDDGNVTTTTDPRVNHTYDSVASYNVTLTVTDTFGATNATTKTVHLNEPPNASFTYSPTEPAEGEQVTFDASGSSDPDGTISTYEWDFDGDGTYDATGETATHTYGTHGDYTSTLRVTDSGGATNTTSETVTVTSLPVANYTYTRSGNQVTFDASGSYDPDGGSITEYAWDIDGDGYVEEYGETVTLDVVDENSPSDVTLRVTDDEGQTNTTTKTLPYTVGYAIPGFTAPAVVVAIVGAGILRRRLR